MHKQESYFGKKNTCIYFILLVYQYVDQKTQLTKETVNCAVDSVSVWKLIVC